MKYKALVIFTILFVTLFTLATVAASDVNDTDAVSEVTDDITQDVDILKATDTQIEENNSILNVADEDTLSADEGSFRDLQDLINGAEEGSTIYLDKDYAFKNTATVEFSKSITIDGRGHYLDGKGKDRIFDIELGKQKHVFLNNITFKNGDVTWTSGGAIRCVSEQGNEASLDIVDCTFDNNHADDGGAIYAEYVRTNILNCRFTNNSADDHGGAIEFDVRESTIRNCHFEDNKAKDYGGAIYFTEHDGDPRERYSRSNVVRDSTFISNQGDYGGAIYTNGCHNEMINCYFYKNHANTDGGAIYAYAPVNGNDGVFQCVFLENSAEDDGGAIYAREYYPRIRYSVFDKNTAEVGKDAYMKFCLCSWDYPYKETDNQDTFASCIFFARDSIFTSFYALGFTECWFPNGHDIKQDKEWRKIYINNEMNLKLEYVKNVDSPYVITGHFTYVQTLSLWYNFLPREFTIETTTGTLNTNKIGFDLNKHSFEYTPDESIQNGEITFKFMSYEHVFKFDQISPVSFTALQSNVTQATESLTLENDYSYSEAGDSHIGSEGILIDKNLTINGNGHVINGNNRTAFQINNPFANITFNNITFVNCNIPINAINAQKITFNNCTFEQNSENIIISCNCEFNDCQFIDNIANNTSILNIEDFCVLNDCYFLDNIANNTSILNVEGVCVLNNAKFVNNVGGESLILLNSTSNVEINGSIFIQNDADKIIHTIKILNKLNVTNNIIINSESEYEIYAESQPQECYLDYNWLGNTADNFNSPYKVNFDANTWYFLNMTLMHDYANVSLNNVYDNVNKRVIRNSGYTLPDLSIGLYFVNMSSSQGSIDFGDDGEIQINVYMLSKPAFLTASYENVNYTVNFTQKGEFDLLNDLITTAADNSTIVLDRDYTFTEGIDSIGGITIRATNITIDGNGHTINALGKSLIFTVCGEKVTLKNLIVVNGHNENVGGYDGPVLWSGHDGVVDNCTFENNTGAQNGAITWTGQNGLIKDSIFKGNAARDGGALYLQGRNMTVTNTTFINNRARLGGAIYVYTTVATVENCTFRYNTATGDGGSVYWNKQNGKISDCEFENNHADSKGGAIFWNDVNGVVTSSKFTLNNAPDGGAVYWNSQEGKLSDCKFANNTATNGGAAYWNANYGTVNSSSFEDNSAQNGGAIFWHYDYGKVINSTFIKNTATNDGGAIYFNEKGDWLDNEQESVEYSTFSENSAVNNGGAIYLAAKKSTIGNTEFSKNSAANGGAIHITAEKSSIGNSTFIKNQAENGGALYASFDYGTISQLIFINNTASDNGNAIYSDSAYTPVNYCIFINNGGSSIYYKDTSWFGSELNADYNWFGNNITNYNAAPPVSEDVVCDYWYFMDMSMADGIASIKLNNIYDKKNSRILTGQSYRLPQINLTLTNENLDVANNASLDENGVDQVAYIPKATQTSLTAHYDAAQVTVNKNYLESTVTIGDKDEFTYGNVSIEFSVENPTTIEIIIINEDNETVFNTTTDERIVNPDLAAGTYTITITNMGTDNVLKSNATKTFKVNKATVKINVVANDVTYPGNIIVNITSNLTGKYTVKIGDQKEEINLTANITKTVTFTGLSANEYIINVTSAETENYTGAINDTVTVNVFKATPTITVSAENAVYPGDLIVNVISDVGGRYTVNVGDKEQDIDLIANVTGKVTFTNLPAKEYIINVNYAETENYTGAINDTVKVNIFKATPTITVSAENVTYPEYLTVNITSDVSGKYTVKVGDQQKEVDLTANTVESITFTGLSANEYLINVTYAETENYTSATNNTVKVSVLKTTPTITVKAENTTYPGDVIITINTDANGKYNITVGNQTKEETLTAGANTITFTGVKVGNYTITVKYAETENYTSAINDTVKVSVLKNEAFEPEITAINTANETVITFTFPEDATGNVTVIVDGKQYNATVENGKATVTMPLIPLDSTVDFEYSGDENYPAKSKETSIANVIAIIKAEDMTRGYDSGVDYQVTVVDGNGNPMAKKQVIFIINGNKYNATSDDKGIAVLNIKLAIGTYAVTTVNPLNNDNVTKTVKITTRITGNKNVDTYYGKNYAYKLCIIGDDGKAVGSNVAVKVTVNGKAQTLKTDKNGHITLKFTKNYLPKTYTVTAEYKGIKVTNKVKVNQVLSLKKVKVKKSAKKLVVKATLKEGKKALKNKKVTFKFKGKKYKAKTNKKGIAKVTIKKSVLKKLKVGKKVTYQVTYLKDTVKRSVKVKK